MSIRVTNYMLNETSKKAGLPVNSSSLLNYINNDKSSNSLLDSLQNNSVKKAAAQNKKLYQKLKDAAEALEQTAKKLSSDKSDSFFAKAKESGDNSEVVKNIKALIEQYNEIRKQLESSSTSSPINAYYNQTLKQLASKNSEALSAVGITIGKDGSMAIDESKLNAAGIEDLEALFGSKSEFIQRLEYLASHVSDNVSAEIESLGNQYGQDANSFSSYIMNKYDWRS